MGPLLMLAAAGSSSLQTLCGGAGRQCPALNAEPAIGWLQIFIILLYFIGGLRVTGAGYFFANWANIVLVSTRRGPQSQH